MITSGKQALSTLLNFGVGEGSTMLDRHRYRVLNSLLLASTLIFSFWLTTNLYFGFWVPALSNGFVLFGILLLAHRWVRKGRLAHASMLYFLGISLSTVVVAMSAYQAGRFSGTENLFFGYGLVALVLFDGRQKRWLYILAIMVTFGLKLARYHFESATIEELMLMLLNVSGIFLFGYLVVNSFGFTLQQALEQSNEQRQILYSMIDNVPVLMALMDVDGRYVMVNRKYEEVFLRKRHHIIGQHYAQVLPSDILNIHDGLVKRALTGESLFFDHQTKHPNGDVTHDYGRYVPVLKPDGEVAGLTVYVSDVSELKAVQQKLENANKTKGRLLSIISHDLRGPLGLFANVLDAFRERIFTDREFLDYQEEIRMRLHTLVTTLNNLLNWARTQQEGIQVQPQEVDLVPIASEVVALYQPMAARKGIALHFGAEKPVQMAYVDKSHLELVMRNLIHNAIKYTESGQVQMTLYETDGTVCLEVTDTGVGFDDQKIREITRGEVTSSTVGTSGEMGTGLGLSVCLDLLRQNLCAFTIRAGAPKGTIIQVQMPAVPSKYPGNGISSEALPA